MPPKPESASSPATSAVSSTGGCRLAPAAALNPSGTAERGCVEPTIESLTPSLVSVRRGTRSVVFELGLTAEGQREAVRSEFHS